MGDVQNYVWDGANWIPESSSGGVVVSLTEFPAPAVLSDASANPTTTSVQSHDMTFNGTTWDRTRSGQTANAAAVTGFANVIPDARYNATPTARTEAQFGALQADVNGNLLVSNQTLIAGEDLTNNALAIIQKPTAVTTYSLTWDESAALETSSVSKAAAGNLYAVFGWNNNAAVRYFHIYNSATVPADTTVPKICIPVAAGGSFSLDLTLYGKQFAAGISWACSTTAATKTLGAADFWVTLGYV